MATNSSDVVVMASATALAQSIQSSAEWRELLNTQKAAKTDGQYAEMVSRHRELARIESNAQARGQRLDGKSSVELIALRDQIQRHELYIRQQVAWAVAVALLQHINEKISQELGLDFGSNAAPRRGGYCG